MLPDAYGCVVSNRFGNLLDDDADPFDLISEVETEKEKDKKKKKKKKEEEEKRKGKQKKPGQRESQKDRRVPIASEGQDPAPAHKQQQEQQQARPESRDGREEGQRGMKRAAAGERRANQEEYPQEFSISKPSHYAESDLRGRGGIRSRRGSRGGGGYTRNPDNFNLRGKREYDRHNGTGISPEEKRGGRGPWNWGCVDEAASELMEVTSDAPVKPEEPQIPVDEENQNKTVEEEDGEAVVQVAVEMTLDEWKAVQEMSRPKAVFNIRKAENKIPSKAKVIHLSKHLENLKGSLEDIEDEGNFLRRSVNDITSLLDINFGSLGRPTRGGRGRGARGGLTSRPERAKPIQERRDDLAPNPDDPEDFPALSTGR
ncbi:intracellular hyaluronan-binding protein 4-like [Toxotes jaculatrix]|uniref:intracellular hyaluronan-binding protein 4-like n=1 Tax=Toxotes jaculatrix TaxID=941984 RepID=UPI001B3B0BC9|nr:intracellular hyaluronan-binding protein 4-like [Toxotes jaculatrix]XP_040899278.1 intracellular hyaluronan-binding protein 4-like [Toxotes jaculatrix]XP_040899279.1 intracellular hyaluronan-binding protein 4-like [Toxotes jaculatrix]